MTYEEQMTRDGFIFALGDVAKQKVKDWFAEHDKTCNFKRGDSFGFRYTYIVAPSGVGTCLSLKCGCGERLDDITDLGDKL